MEEKLQSDLEKINKFTRKNLTSDEVYIFDVILCDNETDRDNERFSVKALNRIASMFIGKTGIFDHNPVGENQNARIFDTCVIADSSVKTSADEPYTYLKARAYMVKTEKNADLIKEIDGGIKKEVSISCSVAKQVCSICGQDNKIKACSHRKGRIYNGKKCVFILDEPTDAYEWSFVAVPAQVNAGVIKHFASENSLNGTVTLKESDYLAMTQRADATEKLAELVRDNLKKEIIKMSFMIHPQVSVKTLARLAEGMEIDELLSFKESLSKDLANMNETKCLKDIKPESNTQFKLK